MFPLRAEVAYFVFELLTLERRDVMSETLEQRRVLLKEHPLSD
jgi:ATP-dependent DNA ligase